MSKSKPKRETLTEVTQKNNIFQWVVSGGGIVISIIALILSLQANSIAKESNRIAILEQTPQLVVLDSQKLSSFNFSYSPGRAACFHILRVVNMGGAKASIVGITADINYKDDKVTVDQIGDAIYLPKKNLTDTLNDLRLFVFSDTHPYGRELGSSPNSTDLQKFPIEIEPRSVVNIYIEIDLLVDGDTYALETPNRDNPNDVFSYKPEALVGYDPIEATYHIIPAIGQSVITESLSCVYAKER